MNLQIQKLAQEAGLFLDLNGNAYPTALTAEEARACYAKFAKLIVQECIGCIDSTDKDVVFTAQGAGIVSAAHNRSIQQIKQHFEID